MSEKKEKAKGLMRRKLDGIVVSNKMTKTIVVRVDSVSDL